MFQKLRLCLTDEFVRKIRGNRYAELLALICLEHQKYSKDQADEPDQIVHCVAETPAVAGSTQHNVTRKRLGNDNKKNLEHAENDDGLSGVKSNGRSLVNEQENQTSYPAQKIAKRSGNIFRKARGYGRAVARI